MSRRVRTGERSPTGQMTRDQSGGLISPLVWLAKFFAISPSRNHCLSRILARRGRDNWTILLQIHANYAVTAGPRRPVCFSALAAQRSAFKPIARRAKATTIPSARAYACGAKPCSHAQRRSAGRPNDRLQRIERAGSEIAINNPECSERRRRRGLARDAR